jgi:hypothetical protein
MVRKLIVVSVTAVFLSVGFYGLTQRKKSTIIETLANQERSKIDSLPALDARGVDAMHEITKRELVKLMTKLRPLSRDESANLDRGCPGLVCLSQRLGVTRWPASARGTVAYLTVGDALKRHFPNSQENFIFVKQGWWSGGSPPKPDPTSGQVSVNSVTRIKPGWYTFNYAVYFSSTATYAWINHREYGFPVNLVSPEKAYLSVSPPPLNDENRRRARIYCSTYR